MRIFYSFSFKRLPIKRKQSLPAHLLQGFNLKMQRTGMPFLQRLGHLIRHNKGKSAFLTILILGGLYFDWHKYLASKVKSCLPKDRQFQQQEKMLQYLYLKLDRSLPFGVNRLLLSVLLEEDKALSQEQMQSFFKKSGYFRAVNQKLATVPLQEFKYILRSRFNLSISVESLLELQRRIASASQKAKAVQQDLIGKREVMLKMIPVYKDKFNQIILSYLQKDPLIALPELRVRLEKDFQIKYISLRDQIRLLKQQRVWSQLINKLTSQGKKSLLFQEDQTSGNSLAQTEEQLKGLLHEYRRVYEKDYDQQL